MKIKIDKLDKVFSRYIRLRDKVCQRCGHFTKSLAAAHFHGRAKKSVRWDEDNACGLCMGCHIYLDSNPFEKIAFFKERLGEEKFDALNEKALTLGKVDRDERMEYYKEKLRDMEDME